MFHVMSKAFSSIKETILFILSISYLVREYEHIHLLNKNKNNSQNLQPQNVVLQREQEQDHFTKYNNHNIIYDHFS